MPRPKKCRRICAMPTHEGFGPLGKGCASSIKMTLDEYETIRLIDLQGLTQEDCSTQMGISRTTVTGIYEHARYKLADALVNGKQLFIEGGDITLCEHQNDRCKMAESTHCCRHKKLNEKECHE